MRWERGRLSVDLGRDDWLALPLEGQSRQPGLCGLNNPGRSVKRAKFSEAQKSGQMQGDRIGVACGGPSEMWTFPAPSRGRSVIGRAEAER